jgi:RHS repeat-associated protein
MYTGSGTTNKSYFHTNCQGSIIAMSSASGLITERHKYDSYGNETDPTGNPFRYTGRRLDEETGLLYYRARYYSPAIGRFLQSDPIGYGDGLNFYAYVGNDPMNATDPEGLSRYGINANVNVENTVGAKLAFKVIFDTESLELIVEGSLGIRAGEGVSFTGDLILGDESQPATGSDGYFKTTYDVSATILNHRFEYIIQEIGASLKHGMLPPIHGQFNHTAGELKLNKDKILGLDASLGITATAGGVINFREVAKGVKKVRRNLKDIYNDIKKGVGDWLTPEEKRETYTCRFYKRDCGD